MTDTLAADPTATPLPFTLGEPLEHRGIVVVPLFPLADPIAAYTTLDDALPRGLRIRETSAAGSVPELTVENPLDERVLLYDGEELVGAKQNRILNVTVLVEAGAKLPIPVSCVEEGRWSSRSAYFAAAPQLSHPELRRRKAQALAAEPLTRGMAQRQVWDEVRAKSHRMRVASPTMAQHDVFDAHRVSLTELAEAFPLRPGQCGAVLALGESFSLDYVSRPEAFERLWPKLRQGYLLDAIESLDRPAAHEARIAGFVDEVADAPVTRGTSAGLGQDVRLRGPAVIGSGLELDGETLQLSAFSSDGEAGRTFGRIVRPSRRRGA